MPMAPVPLNAPAWKRMKVGQAGAEPTNFPKRIVLVLALAMTMNQITQASLFPYVGMMVKDLLGLETTNEAGARGCAFGASHLRVFDHGTLQHVALIIYTYHTGTGQIVQQRSIGSVGHVRCNRWGYW